MKISPRYDSSDLFEALFANAPADEPLKLSILRLERAILFDEAKNEAYAPSEPDDPAPTFNAATVYTAYLLHPDLHLPYLESRKKYNERKSVRDRIAKQSVRAKRAANLIARALR